MQIITDLDALIQFAITESSNGGGIPFLPHKKAELFRASHDVSPEEFFNLFARRVAHEYEARNLNFETADAAMNSLHGYVINQYDVSLPSYAEDVFLAFDAGEFFHRDDSEDIDPEEKYTRPQIQSIVIRDRILGT